MYQSCSLVMGPLSRTCTDSLGSTFARRTWWLKKKLGVASSLLLSEETFAVGCMPVLNSAERQMLHRNSLSVYRNATSTCVSIDYELNHNYSDAVLLHAYELRAPYSYVRFHRLRLSVRLFLRCPFPLLVLIISAIKDARSWIFALSTDLVWLQRCDPTCKFDLSEWYRFVRGEP